jgi:hypothetical protein
LSKVENTSSMFGYFREYVPALSEMNNF